MMRSQRKRLREIEFNKIEEIKESFGFSWKEIASFLGVSAGQLARYKASYRLPADRFYSFKDALLVAAEEDARQIREKILKLFN